MKNLIKSTSMALLAAAFVTSGQAADSSEKSWADGIYLSLSGGGQTRGRAGETATTWTDWDPGEMANLSVGYQMNPYARFEVEGSMFHNNADVLSPGSTALVAPAEGDAFMRAVMFNLFLEYPIKNTKFTPYVGGGVGFYKSYLRDLSNGMVRPFGFVFDGTSQGERFAYQIRAGVSYALTDHLDLWGGYRFFDGGQLDFVFADVPIGSGATFSASPKATEMHGAEIGVRWTF